MHVGQKRELWLADKEEYLMDEDCKFYQMAGHCLPASVYLPTDVRGPHYNIIFQMQLDASPNRTGTTVQSLQQKCHSITPYTTCALKHLAAKRTGESVTTIVVQLVKFKMLEKLQDRQVREIPKDRRKLLAKSDQWPMPANPILATSLVHMNDEGVRTGSETSASVRLWILVIRRKMHRKKPEQNKTVIDLNQAPHRSKCSSRTLSTVPYSTSQGIRLKHGIDYAAIIKKPTTGFSAQTNVNEIGSLNGHNSGLSGLKSMLVARESDGHKIQDMTHGPDVNGTIAPLKNDEERYS
ncbi:hypothetical protein STEG23_003395 [Scotinomys teguina]